MKDLYERWLRFSRNPELSPGQRAYWAEMALRAALAVSMGGHR